MRKSSVSSRVKPEQSTCGTASMPYLFWISAQTPRVPARRRGRRVCSPAMHLMGGSTGWRLRRSLGDGTAALAAWYGAVLLRLHVPLPLTTGLLPADRIALVQPVTLLVVALQLLTV